METTLLIEADGQPSVTIQIEAAPDIVFEDAGIQGVPGNPGPPGPGLDNFDPGDLTLIFENQLI
jgi:hypothetical protein